MEITDRLVAEEDDLGTANHRSCELASAIGGDGYGANVREKGGAVVDVRVIRVRVIKFLVTDVRPETRIGPGDIERTAIGKGQPRGARQDRAAAARNEVAVHAGVAEDRQSASAGLDDLARTCENADGSIEPLVDVNTKTVVVVGTRRDRRLKLIVIVTCLEVMEEVKAHCGGTASNVDRGVRETDFRRAVQDHGGDPRHTLGEAVAQLSIIGARGDIRG